MSVLQLYGALTAPQDLLQLSLRLQLGTRHINTAAPAKKLQVHATAVIRDGPTAARRRKKRRAPKSALYDRLSVHINVFDARRAAVDIA